MAGRFLNKLQHIPTPNAGQELPLRDLDDLHNLLNSKFHLDAFPLGLREWVSYQSLEISLEPGDRIIFCSDSIVEAPNEAV